SRSAGDEEALGSSATRSRPNWTPTDRAPLSQRDASGVRPRTCPLWTVRPRNSLHVWPRARWTDGKTSRFRDMSGVRPRTWPFWSRARQEDDGLDVRRVREHVHRSRSLEPVAPVTLEVLHVRG